MTSNRDRTRRLILLRHAKSSWPDGVPDPERPLAERGIANATAAGPILAGIGIPDVVLCSPARRTRQTWELIAPAFGDPPVPRFEPVIYGADVPELLDLIRAVPEDAGNVLVIGHEPTLSSTASRLAGPGSNAEDLARLSTKYPTGAAAVFGVPPAWTEVSAKSAVLEQFVVPQRTKQ